MSWASFATHARTSSLARDAYERWGVTAPGPDAPRLAQQAFVYAVTASALAEAASRHPDWVTVGHEDLCRDATTELRALAERLGLTWTDAATTFVAESDQQGSGFVTARVAAHQEDRWRERLSGEDVEVVRSVLAGFPAGLLADC